MDKRHQHRIKQVKDLFAFSFNRKKEPLLDPIIAHLKEIDKMIEQYAPRYPTDKIAKIDLAILRLSIYEIMFEKKNPVKVVIDEAIILSKEFGTEKSYAFINGVLGAVLKNKITG